MGLVNQPVTRKDTMMKVRSGIILTLLATLALACAIFPLGTEEEVQPENSVLFQDDFSDPLSGWDQVDVSDGVTDYVDGVYRIFVNTTNTDVWANPGLSFNDSYVEVMATKVGGDNNNDFGLICRYQDENNFYFFIISSDGYYGIGKVVNGEQLLIGNDSMPPSEVIRQGDESNHLRAGCVGSQLSLAVNGQILAEYEDTDFVSGDIGLLAGSFENPGTDIHFDNLVVTKP
jgi:hypothetical protein